MRIICSNAKCRFETFVTVIEPVIKDRVEVTVVYIVADTLLIVPFKKDGVEVRFNVAKLASPGVGNIVAELPPGGTRIKELFVALLATYGVANEVAAFVVGRGDTTDELELDSVLLADDVEGFATLVPADGPSVVVAIAETAFITSSSVGDELVLDEGVPRDVSMELPRVVESPRINPSPIAAATPSSPESIATSNATAKS